MPETTARQSARNTKNIPIPLDHPRCESVRKQTAFLIYSGVLNQEECGRLTKEGRQLREIDYVIARFFMGRPFIKTSIRPRFIDEYRCFASPCFGMPQIEVWVGWVLRLEEDIEKLERKYFPVLREGGDDDI